MELSSGTINLSLWIPFLVLVLILGIIFCIGGYKKGIWHALISLGATVLSAGLSVLLAGWIAPLLNKMFSSGIAVLTSSVTESLDNAALAQMAGTMIGGLVGSVIALMLFAVLFAVFTIVLKLLFRLIRHEALNVEKTPLKIAGLGIRALDAVLFSFVILIPLYGTINVYAPVAGKVLKGEEYSEINECVTSAEEHLLVVAADFAPFSLMYRELASVDLGSGKVDLVAVADQAGTALDYVGTLQDKPLTELGKEDLGMIEYMRDEMVDSELFDAMAGQMVDQIKEQPGMGELVDSLGLTEENLGENVSAFLDLAHFAVENEMSEVLSGGQLDLNQAATAGLQNELGKMVNSTAQMVNLREYVINEGVNSLFGGESEKNAELLSELLKNVNSAPLTGQEDIAKEGEAILLMVSASESENLGMADVVEALARHPMIGTEAVVEFLEQSEDTVFATHPVLSDEAVFSDLMDKLAECAEGDLTGTRFSDYCREAIEAAENQETE